MKDIHRVWLLLFIACIPFVFALLAVALVTSTAIAPVTFEHFLILLAAAIFGCFIIRRSDRLRHYNKMFGIHEDNYRYVKDPIIIDENWGISDAGAPEEGDDYVA